MKYQAEKVPLVVFAGAEYGNGSSRDWAAKGTRLLGVRAVICQSFERIHRSNLVGMGVLPLTFEEGVSWESIGLKGDETVTIRGLQGDLKPRQKLTAEIVSQNGSLQRVNRDIRFSNDKRPYKESLNVWFWHGDNKGWDTPGFWFSVSAKEVYLGVGMHSL